MAEAKEYQRARRPEQKEERRAHLIAVAQQMLAENTDLRDLSLNELARRAGMTKSNVYRYFESREAVLLEVLGEEWRLVGESLQRGLRVAPPAMSIEAIAELFTRAIAGRHLMLNLTSALPSVIEHNISETRIRDFKEGMLSIEQSWASQLHVRLPELSLEAWREFLRFSGALMTGLWPLSHPSDRACAVLSEPRYAALRYDFARDYAQSLQMYLRGLAKAKS